MSLREIFIKNSITYKIYIYYNLYIRNKAYRKRKFYSQWGEDIFLQKHFENKNIGFYVDIGCFHPTKFNNTNKMYQAGWTGINIDLNPFTIDLFKFARPRDINICAAVSNKKGFKNLFFDHQLSSLNTISKNHTLFIEKASSVFPLSPSKKSKHNFLSIPS